MKMRPRVDLAWLLWPLVAIFVPGIVSAGEDGGVRKERLTLPQALGTAWSELMRRSVVRTPDGSAVSVDYSALSEILNELAARPPNRLPEPEDRADENTRIAGYALAILYALWDGREADVADPWEAERSGRADAVRALWRLTEAVYSDSTGSPIVRRDCVVQVCALRAGNSFWSQGLKYASDDLPPLPSSMSKCEAVQIATGEPPQCQSDRFEASLVDEAFDRRAEEGASAVLQSAGETNDLKFRALLTRHSRRSGGQWVPGAPAGSADDVGLRHRLAKRVIEPARLCVGSELRVPIHAHTSSLTCCRDLTQQLIPCIRSIVASCERPAPDADRPLADWFDGWPCIHIDSITLTCGDSVIVRLRGEELGVDERWAFKAVRGLTCPGEQR